MAVRGILLIIVISKQSSCIPNVKGYMIFEEVEASRYVKKIFHRNKKRKQEVK